MTSPSRNLQTPARQLFIVVSFFLFCASATAKEPIYTELFSNDAIRGYDTVAYFIDNKALKGKTEFSTEYMGANWLFVSAANLKLFKVNPEKYAPQYGGYCAYAVSKGSTASIEPDQFTIENGKLYLNYNRSVNKKWLADKTRFIGLADKNWPVVLQ